jgi:hypothetical protein
MRLAIPIAIILLAAALLAGCGGSSSSSETTGSTVPPGGAATAPAGASARSCETEAVDAEALRATGVSCGDARDVLFAWQRAPACAAEPGASHSACTVDSYRCIGARTDRGLAVSCARAGRSIAFVAERG